MDCIYHGPRYPTAAGIVSCCPRKGQRLSQLPARPTIIDAVPERHDAADRITRDASNCGRYTAAATVTKLIHTATSDTCLCRVCFGGVNCIPDNSRLSPTENLNSEHVQSNRPFTLFRYTQFLTFRQLPWHPSVRVSVCLSVGHDPDPCETLQPMEIPFRGDRLACIG